MTAEEIMKIAGKFGFKDINDFDEWARSDTDDYRLDDQKGKALYTDGDMGVALVQLSEIDPDLGLMIDLIDCKYCNFNLLCLGFLHDELLEAQDDFE